MDFYKNKKGTKGVRIFIILASLVLLGINIYLSISEDSIKYLAIIANVLLILAMLFSIRNSNKENSKLKL